MRHHLNLLAPMASTRYSLSKKVVQHWRRRFSDIDRRSRKPVPNGGGDRKDDTLRVHERIPRAFST